MLRHTDDFPLHQTVDTFDTPATSDPRWFDRYWFMTGDVDERICLIAGIGSYPNTQRIDGYAMLSDGTHQWNVRVGRDSDGDQLALDAHGLTFLLLDPMRRWKLVCAQPEGLYFDLSWERRYDPNNLPALVVEKNGETIMEMAHFAQGGEVSGKINAFGRRIQVSGWPSERDHSWGRRPPSGKVRSGIHVWLPAQVGDRQIWLWFRENTEGKRLGLEGAIRYRDGRVVAVRDVRHNIEVAEYVPPHRQLVKARLELDLDDGSSMLVEVEPVVPVFIAGGGYVEGEGAQGSYDGRSLTSWDVSSKAGLDEIPLGIIDHFSRISVDGEIGQGVFELSVGRYAPLGFEEPR